MNLTDFAYILQVVLGIGLVIFVHELGHFMAARWCGVRVEVFSLGFGPRLFGWRRGDTLFQVAAVPLGGYVKVAGEYFDGSKDKEPGTLSSMNVPQRFLYYSGGVIMNVVFALVVMPLVMFAGMPAVQPVIGAPTPGLPAWEAGLPAGSRMLEVGGQPIEDFVQLYTAVAVNGKGPVELTYLEPGDTERRTVTLTPQYNEDTGVYQVGLPQGVDPDVKLRVIPGSPAAKAGLTEQDRLLGVVGQPSVLPLTEQFAFARDSQEPIELRVANPEGVERVVRVEPKVESTDVRRAGVGPRTTLVNAVRSTGPAAELVAALDIRGEDIVVGIGDTAVYGTLDVVAALDAVDPGDELALDVIRGGALIRLTATVPGHVDPLLLREDLAFAVVENGTVISVQPDTPAMRAGLLDGDEIVSVGGVVVTTWTDLLEKFRATIKRSMPLELVIRRPVENGPGAELGETRTLEITVMAEPVTQANYGLALQGATMIVRASSIGEAISSGVARTKGMLLDVWLQLKKMLFSDEISTKNLGGIISISVVSFETASQGLPKLFFLLAFISINLAIINLLPIPILDGGHLMFLLIEAVKGSPVSERTFGYSQVVGLVMIMSLMVYVTYQDIVRWFLPG